MGLIESNWKIFANETPFGDLSSPEILQLVARCDVRPERPDDEDAPQLSDGIWELAEQCWVKNPKRRPTANAVCDIISDLLRTTPIAWPLDDLSLRPTESERLPPTENDELLIEEGEHAEERRKLKVKMWRESETKGMEEMQQAETEEQRPAEQKHKKELEMKKKEERIEEAEERRRAVEAEKKAQEEQLTERRAVDEKMAKDEERLYAKTSKKAQEEQLTQGIMAEEGEEKRNAEEAPKIEQEDRLAQERITEEEGKAKVGNLLLVSIFW